MIKERVISAGLDPMKVRSVSKEADGVRGQQTCPPVITQRESELSHRGAPRLLAEAGNKLFPLCLLCARQR